MTLSYYNKLCLGVPVNVLGIVVIFLGGMVTCDTVLKVVWKFGLHALEMTQGLISQLTLVLDVGAAGWKRTN